jgi:hypothetical protein
MLTMLARQNTCRPLLTYCGGLIASSRDDVELMCCFKFLYWFGDRCADRQITVYNVARCELFSYMAERFHQASCETQTDALEVLTSIVGLFRPTCGNYVPAVELLKTGALHAVKSAALPVLSSVETPGEPELIRLERAVCALGLILDAVFRAPAGQRAQLSEEMYKLPRNDMYRITVAVYGLIPVFCGNPKFTKFAIQQFSRFAMICAAYVRAMWGTGALRSYLLYKPQRAVDAKPMAQMLAEWAVACGEAYSEFPIMSPLREFARILSQIADILRGLPSAPQRVVKDRHCALPDCLVSGEGLHNNMKKCTRCKAVYYCCKEHQVLHWPEHRLTCVKVVEPVGETVD